MPSTHSILIIRPVWLSVPLFDSRRGLRRVFCCKLHKNSTVPLTLFDIRVLKAELENFSVQYVNAHWLQNKLPMVSAREHVIWLHKTKSKTLVTIKCIVICHGSILIRTIHECSYNSTKYQDKVMDTHSPNGGAYLLALKQTAHKRQHQSKNPATCCH